MKIRHPQLILNCTFFALVLLTFSSISFAFPDYDGCKNCHGDFNENSSYTSKTDLTNWGSNLMNGHSAFGISCNTCHNDGGYGEVFLNSNYGAPTEAPFSKSCVGCHGRDEDVTNNCVGGSGVQVECGSGAGLRQVHEMNVGANTCNSCHTGDATPVGEQNNPPYYGTLTGVLMTDACNADSSESQYGDYGLDNDGDGQADGDDSDCQAAQAFVINPGLSGNWWGGSTRSGEGFLIDVAYNINAQPFLVVSFYTYDSMGNQVFLVGAVATNGDSATVPLEITQGAKWGADFIPADVVRTPWGTVTFTFSSCEAAHVAFEPNVDMQALGFTNLEYDINRDILIPGIQCPIENP